MFHFIRRNLSSLDRFKHTTTELQPGSTHTTDANDANGHANNHAKG